MIVWFSKMNHEWTKHGVSASKMNHEWTKHDVSASKMNHEWTKHYVSASKMNHEWTKHGFSASKMNHEWTKHSVSASKMNQEWTKQGGWWHIYRYIRVDEFMCLNDLTGSMHAFKNMHIVTQLSLTLTWEYVCYLFKLKKVNTVNNEQPMECKYSFCSKVNWYI